MDVCLDYFSDSADSDVSPEGGSAHSGGTVDTATKQARQSQSPPPVHVYTPQQSSEDEEEGRGGLLSGVCGGGTILQGGVCVVRRCPQKRLLNTHTLECVLGCAHTVVKDLPAKEEGGVFNYLWSCFPGLSVLQKVTLATIPVLYGVVKVMEFLATL